MYFLTQPIEPRLKPCVTFIAARGLDRVVVLLEWVVVSLALVQSKLLNCPLIMIMLLQGMSHSSVGQLVQWIFATAFVHSKTREIRLGISLHFTFLSFSEFSAEHLDPLPVWCTTMGGQICRIFLSARLSRKISFC